ncbi:MAG: DUF1223 domain-containing protein [Piscinibacter sp.]|nr:DUF1223 domain-containing protein [Piscinibacter sp.]
MTPRTLAATLLSLSAPLALAQAAGQCSARSGEQVTPVVELYTSEGCSSCPPADRWLSTLKREPSVVALAFHVNYWDRLGWRDRFATPAFTQRQGEQQAVNGARYNYTPQVVVQGVDRRDWYARPQPTSVEGRALVDITLAADGRGITAQVRSRAGAPARLAAYWAVTEDGHRSAVTAGENAGEKLVHDYVVRELVPVPAWDGVSTTLKFEPAGAAQAGHPRAVNLVVTDAATGRPVQALRLPC